jgi:hypothetical protein
MRPEEQRRPSAPTQLAATDPVQAGLIWRGISTSGWLTMQDFGKNQQY